MKSSQSCFEPGLARVQTRRFLPAWAMYGLGLILIFLVSMGGGLTDEAAYLYGIKDMIKIMVVINFLYACLLCQLLFGDLYNSRLCYGLFSLPMSRGGWFGTQICLGILWSLIPNALFSGCVLLFAGDMGYLVGWMFLAMELEFLFFFGVGVLCAILAGNRLGMLAGYGILHLGGLLIYWFAWMVYEPLLFGIELHSEISSKICPLWNLVSLIYLNFNFVYEQDAKGIVQLAEKNVTVNSGSWWAMAALAVLGCVCIYSAKKLLKRRKLESCGDFLAFAWCKPVFLVLFPLAAGCGFQAVAFAFNSNDLGTPFLVLGVVLGYFAALMLVKGQIMVFSPRSAGMAASLAAALLVSMAMCGLDVFGITQRLPKAENIALVAIEERYNNDDKNVVYPDEASIREVLRMQEMILELNRQERAGMSLLKRAFSPYRTEYGTIPDGNGDFHEVQGFTFRYTRKDGSTVRRSYTVCTMDPVFEDLRAFRSRPEYVFGRNLADFMLLQNEGLYLEVRCNHDYEVDEEISYGNVIYAKEVPQPSMVITDRATIAAFMEAAAADCREGNLTQSWFFGSCDDSVRIIPSSVSSLNRDMYLRITDDRAVHIQEWMKEIGFH